MRQRTCSEPDCEGWVVSRGWCGTHYSRWIRRGDPQKVIAPKDRNVVKNRVSKVCPFCKETFEIRMSKADRYNFCSLACKREAGKALMVSTPCETCGEELIEYASQRARRWCSVQCQIDGATATSCCVNCRKVYTLPSNMMRVRRSCSQECSQKLRWQWRSAFGSFRQKLESGYRTDIETMAEEVLIELDVRYDFEYRVGRSWIDFALPDLMIGLECDGWQHERRHEKDTERDEVLLSKGWRIVRVLDAALRADARGAILTAIPELLSGRTYEAPYEQLQLLNYPTTA